MRNIKTILILALFIFFSFNSLAAKWTKIDEDSDLSLFIDESSIIKKKELTEVWMKKKFKSSRYLIRFKSNFIEMRAYQNYDCKNKKLTYKQVLIYDKDGSEVGNISVDYARWEDVELGSHNEIIYNYICNLKNQHS